MPDQIDPTERLRRLGTDLEAAPTPFTAADARRQGDRLRRRSTAIRSGVAAVALAAIALPLALSGHHGHDDTRVTDPTTAGVSGQNVLADGETVGDDGGRWVRQDDGTDEVAGSANPCARSTFAALGATTTHRRSWTSVGSARPAGPDDLGEVVAQFGTDAEAQAAFDRMGTWLGSCVQGRGQYLVAAPTPVDLRIDGARGLVYRTDAESRGPATDLMETGVVVSGDRVAVLTWQYRGQDFGVSPTPVERMLPTAAARLAGTTPTVQEQPSGSATTGEASGSGAATRIPDGFPLDAGWPLDSAEGPDSVLAPSRTRRVDELAACGRTLPWPEHVDRVTAGFHNPEDGRDRTLTTYADADAAVAATQAIVSLFQGCTSEPGQPTGYVHHYQVSRTTLSGDSWLISNWYTYRGADALGLTDIQVVRVGLAVLVMSHSNEGGLSSIPQDVHTMTTQAAQPLAAMCVFTEAGC